MTPRSRTFSLALKVHSAEVTYHGSSGVILLTKAYSRGEGIMVEPGGVEPPTS